MGTPRTFSRILHEHTTFHAAWYPVANTWSVGDIGVVSDGVLVRTGNLADLGVNFAAAPTAPVHGLNFTSEGTKSARFLGDAEVNALPDSDIEARLNVEFTKSESFFLKAATLRVEEMTGLDSVAAELSKLRDRRWRRKYRVVHATAAADQLAFVSAREAGASFEIRGTARALQQLDLGKAEAGLEIVSSSSLGLDFVGDSGIIGIRLFKLGPWRGGLRLLGPDEGEELTVDQETDHALADDV